MIIQILVILVVLSLVTPIVWGFIKETRTHRKRMRKLDEWSQFHQNLMNWSREIQDVDVRNNFINECVSRLVLGDSDRLDFDKDMLDDWSIDESKKNICDKWGKHIPSLAQEIREKKLNQIL
jgi:competence protein ComGF